MRWFAAAIAILLTASTPARAHDVRTCNTSAADEKIVADTIHAFYEAERTGDSAGWRHLTTPDFRMFHEGVVEAPDAFAKWIDHEHAGLLKDNAASWTLDVSDLVISIDCTTAFTTQKLHNVAAVPTLKPGYRYDESFLESFLLRKLPNAEWRIAFWNAAKMPKETPGWAQVK